MACSRIMNGIHAQHALHCVACTLESPSIECVFKIHVQVHALTIVKAVLWRIKILRVMSESFSLQNYRLPVGTKPPSNLTKSKAWSKDKKRLRPGSHTSQTRTTDPRQRSGTNGRSWTPLPPLCDQCERKHACHHSPSALHACREHAGGCFAHLSLHNSAY
jgi:hypothetical protein